MLIYDLLRQVQENWLTTVEEVIKVVGELEPVVLPLIAAGKRDINLGLYFYVIIELIYNN
jgi:hypothetical protein